MSINGSSINGASINGAGNVSFETITESIETHAYADPSLPYFPVNESLSFSDSTSLTQGIEVLERLILSAPTSASVVTSDSITDYINLLDSIILTFKGTISETLTFSSAVSIITDNTQIVTESLIVNSSVSDRVTFLNVLAELISILDSNSFGYSFTISETLAINGAVTELYKAILTIAESLSLIETHLDSYINVVSLSSSLNLSGNTGSNVDLYETLSDELIIQIPSASGQDTYLGYTFSPENNAVTTYTNYNFDGCAKFNGKYYFFNSTGLYEYGAVTDDGSLIRSIIETAGYTFGTSNKKQIPQVYLGATNSDLLIMKVRVDGKGEFHYRLRKYTNELDTQKIKIGKGLIGRYFQFELITDAEEFNMESIEFFPIVLKRKL